MVTTNPELASKVGADATAPNAPAAALGAQKLFDRQPQQSNETTGGRQRGHLWQMPL